ncbi:VacJ family lipoprotein [Luteibacter sp. SG786]|uniref:MlaA family lipoprotein n=1 Tax=Luteibacter sp. SG786 TaxID=2587130 RepID=UPI00141FF3AB|nr:VacJ family lipoprotein [Luteibacter sp. SG786]NII53290.1 phospholipid-binding lipoprotein MlaA [Luteibacter sp. SG786]
MSRLPTPPFPSLTSSRARRAIRRRSGARRIAVMAAVSATILSGCSHRVRSDEPVPGPSASTRNDEPVNRAVFAFNKGLDHAIIRPVARGYSHLPAPVKGGVHNFSQNLREPLVFANDLLQANFLRSLNTAGRFLINSTIGVVGIFDVAGHWNMPHHSADLGQTFGVWGMGPGHTVELPVFGSSNVRDAVGRILTMSLYNLGDNSDTVSTVNTVGTVGGIVDGRARALPLTDKLERSEDYYAALRDVSAQRRARFVEEGRDGAVHQPEQRGDGRAATGLPMNP